MLAGLCGGYKRQAAHRFVRIVSFFVAARRISSGLEFCSNYK